MELTLSQVILFIIALVFLFIIIKIIFDIKTKGIDLVDAIRDIFIFGK